MLNFININLKQACYLISSNACKRTYKSVVPNIPCIKTSKVLQPQEVDLDSETILLIERLSLVRFNDSDGTQRLKEGIAFANQLFEVDTTNVEPLYSVQENKSIKLRDDTGTLQNSRKSLLGTAVQTDENYFVAPPGNIPLKNKD